MNYSIPGQAFNSFFVLRLCATKEQANLLLAHESVRLILMGYNPEPAVFQAGMYIRGKLRIGQRFNMLHPQEAEELAKLFGIEV